MSVPFELNDYPRNFSPTEYLHLYYKTPGAGENELFDFFIRNVHKALIGWSSKVLQPSENVQVRFLDFGSGPTISSAIIAAAIPNVCEIVLAEYTSRNREAVKQWLDKDPLAFNWFPYFKYVVETLEGKTDQQAVEREERVRSLVKVVSCDITLDSPIEKGYEGPYDVVISSMCLLTCCKTADEYKRGVAKLTSMMKPGGHLLFFTLDKQPEEGETSYYTVGSHHFVHLNVSCELVVSALTEAGLSITSINRFEKSGDSDIPQNNKYVFVNAEKN